MKTHKIHGKKTMYTNVYIDQSAKTLGCKIKFHILVGDESPLRRFLIKTLVNIIKNNERKNKSYLIQISSHYAIHIIGIDSQLIHKKKLCKRWMISEEGCFKDKEKFVLCLKMAFRKKAAALFLKKILNFEKRNSIKLDHNTQFSWGICGDIQNSVLFSFDVDDYNNHEKESNQPIEDTINSYFGKNYYFDTIEEMANRIIW